MTTQTKNLTLSLANQRWHLALDWQYQTLLETLTALELSTAQLIWQDFKTSLTAHIEFEHEHIEPLAEALPDEAKLDKTRFDVNIFKLIQADHLILNRLLIKVDTALNEIRNAKKPRTELVQQLNILIKLRNVLEHHDLREAENLYPALEAEIDAETLAALAEKMQQTQDALSQNLPTFA
ncbi:MAG: hypothetical protein V3V09_02715 [Arenicellales bacterium]